MKIPLPCTPFFLHVALVKKPGRSWLRLRLADGIFLVALSAVVAWYGIGYLKERESRTFSVTYPVADLIGPSTGLEELAKEVRGQVPRGGGWFPVERRVTPFSLSLSLIVRDSPAGHRAVESWLRGRGGVGLAGVFLGKPDR